MFSRETLDRLITGQWVKLLMMGQIGGEGGPRSSYPSSPRHGLGLAGVCWGGSILQQGSTKRTAGLTHAYIHNIIREVCV